MHLWRWLWICSWRLQWLSVNVCLRSWCRSNAFDTFSVFFYCCFVTNCKNVKFLSRMSLKILMILHKRAARTTSTSFETVTQKPQQLEKLEKPSLKVHLRALICMSQSSSEDVEFCSGAHVIEHTVQPPHLLIIWLHKSESLVSMATKQTLSTEEDLRCGWKLWKKWTKKTVKLVNLCFGIFYFYCNNQSDHVNERNVWAGPCFLAPPTSVTIGT